MLASPVTAPPALEEEEEEEPPPGPAAGSAPVERWNISAKAGAQADSVAYTQAVSPY